MHVLVLTSELVKRSHNSSISTASSVETNLHPKHSITLTHVSTNFPRTQEPPQNSELQKGEKRQVAYCGPKYISRQRTQFSRQDSCICALRSVVRAVLPHRTGGASRMSCHLRFIHSFIHSLVFSLRGRVGRNQSPVM